MLCTHHQMACAAPASLRGFWLASLLLTLHVWAGSCGGAPTYAPAVINRTCKYATSGINATLFFNGGGKE
jgi:hypothetical protein